MNPRAEVPALVDGDFALYDSTVICEYLEDRYPEPAIYPRDPRLRAECRLLEDLADTQLDAAAYAVTLVEYGRGESHPHLMATTFLGFPLDPGRHAALLGWIDRVQARPAVARDNADVMATLQRLEAEGRPGFDPYLVQWRSDRLEWVMKNGFAGWLADEMRGGRAFFPLPVRQVGRAS